MAKTLAERTAFLRKAVAAFTKSGDLPLLRKAHTLLAAAEAEEGDGPTEADLIHEAGNLNNNAKLVNTDHVSIMGLMDRAEMVRHVEKLRALAA